MKDGRFSDYFYRVRNGHVDHPTWTLDELVGRKKKFFGCTLIKGFVTRAMKGFRGWAEASFEIWVEGLVLEGVDGSEDWWEGLVDELDDWLEFDGDSKVNNDEGIIPLYKMTKVQGGGGVVLGEFWGLAVERNRMLKEENLNVSVKVYRTTNGGYDSIKDCEMSLSLRWSGENLEVE